MLLISTLLPYRVLDRLKTHHLVICVDLSSVPVSCAYGEKIRDQLPGFSNNETRAEYFEIMMSLKSFQMIYFPAYLNKIQQKKIFLLHKKRINLGNNIFSKYVTAKYFHTFTTP